MQIITKRRHIFDIAPWYNFNFSQVHIGLSQRHLYNDVIKLLLLFFSVIQNWARFTVHIYMISEKDLTVILFQ